MFLTLFVSNITEQEAERLRQVTQDHSNCTIRKLGYDFLFALHSNYGSILYHFRDKARYWPKIAIFS